MSIQFHVSEVRAGAHALDMIEAAKNAVQFTDAQKVRARAAVLKGAYESYKALLARVGDAQNELHGACMSYLEDMKRDRALAAKIKRERREQAIAEREAMQAMLAV